MWWWLSGWMWMLLWAWASPWMWRVPPWTLAATPPLLKLWAGPGIELWAGPGQLWPPTPWLAGKKVAAPASTLALAVPEAERGADAADALAAPASPTAQPSAAHGLAAHLSLIHI